MYLPTHFEQSDRGALHALIRAHPLGAWVVQGGDGLDANHIPFLLDAQRGPLGTLVGHVARANPVWRALGAEGGADSLVIFQGAQSYVSPSWYASKREHGKVVPTWNYAVVHAHGAPRAIHDRQWLRELVTRLTAEHEQRIAATSSAAPWQVADAPHAFIDGMLDAIVGIEIPIARLAGKWKTSQNRTEADRRGVAAALLALHEKGGGDEAAAMAALVGRSETRKP